MKPTVRSLVDQMVNRLIGEDYEPDPALNGMSADELKAAFNQATQQFRDKNHLLMLVDASGDGTTSVTMGVWHDHRGIPVKDDEVISLWSGTEGAHGGAWYTPEPDAQIDVEDQDASVYKYGNWTVTEQDLQALAQLVIHQWDGTGGHEPDEETIGSGQANSMLGQAPQILQALNGG